MGAGKTAKAAIDAALAARDPQAAAAAKAAEKAAKAQARRQKAADKTAAKTKAKKAEEDADSNVWGPYEADTDGEVDPESLVQNKVCCWA